MGLEWIIGIWLGIIFISTDVHCIGSSSVGDYGLPVVFCCCILF